MKSQVLALVQRIVDKKGIKPTVSNGWWERFAVRHPQLSLRTAVPLSLARAMATDPAVVTAIFLKTASIRTPFLTNQE